MSTAAAAAASIRCTVLSYVSDLAASTCSTKEATTAVTAAAASVYTAAQENTAWTTHTTLQRYTDSAESVRPSSTARSAACISG
jgi:hypothetical protein